MTGVAKLLSGPLFVGGVGLAMFGLAVHVAAYVSDVPEQVVASLILVAFGLGLLGFPGGWVLQGGWTAYTSPEGWGLVRGWSRRASVGISLALGFVLLNFVAMMLIRTPAALARQVGAVMGVVGILLAAGAWFQLATPAKDWMRKCENGHPTATFRTRCGRCGAKLTMPPA